MFNKYNIWICIGYDIENDTLKYNCKAFGFGYESGFGIFKEDGIAYIGVRSNIRFLFRTLFIAKNSERILTFVVKTALSLLNHLNSEFKCIRKSGYYVDIQGLYPEMTKLEFNAYMTRFGELVKQIDEAEAISTIVTGVIGTEVDISICEV